MRWGALYTSVEAYEADCFRTAAFFDRAALRGTKGRRGRRVGVTQDAATGSLRRKLKGIRFLLANNRFIRLLFDGPHEVGKSGTSPKPQSACIFVVFFVRKNYK